MRFFTMMRSEGFIDKHCDGILPVHGLQKVLK